MLIIVSIVGGEWSARAVREPRRRYLTRGSIGLAALEKKNWTSGVRWNDNQGGAAAKELFDEHDRIDPLWKTGR
jgi:hypothetical protein